MKTTILVTGSNGLLGQKIVYKLLQRNDVNLIAASKGENRLIEKNGYTYINLDISKSEDVLAAIEKFQPQVIINTAAMTNVDECETKREECWGANVTAVENFVKAINGSAIHFIHLSTDFVFDGQAGPYREEDQPNPLSYYALSKYEAEKILQKSNISWAILRTIIVYGIVDNMSRSNVVLWAKGALEKGQSINVVDDQFRSPTLAEDLADACISAADKHAKGIYHVSGKDIMSILELVYRVADFWKLDKSIVKPIKSDTLNQAAKRPPRTGFILDKAYRELDYKPHSFEEGLQILDAQLKKN
ncbi:MAG: dTDP-4-dehydrorhamnose reductase [Bacteroidia bacterium]|nr:dTDP-4-dehydrorhamnose reductase [Bacteroidia bacterium]